MTHPANLKSLQALELAVRLGSFRAAGEVLGITPAAVGQRVRSLEDYLDMDLVSRDRSGVKPSAELADILPSLHAGFAELGKAAEAMEGLRSRELHIAATSDLADIWLAPRLEDFRKRHPHLRICLNGSGDVPPRLARADCEIVLAEADERDNGDLLFRLCVAPVASRVNIERANKAPAGERLEGFPLLHLDAFRDDPAHMTWPEWVRRHRMARTAPERGIRFRRVSTAIDAVLADAGFALLDLNLVAPLIEAGEIGLIFPRQEPHLSSFGFVARFRTDQAAKPHVRQFREWLAEEAARTTERLPAILAR